MDVVFYVSGFEGKQTLFEKEVISLIPQKKRTVCKSQKELADVLRRSIADQTICVVAAGTKKNLLALFSIRELIRNSKLILVLPDNSTDTIELCHTLYPRFIDFNHSNFTNIAAVLTKMAHLSPDDLSENSTREHLSDP